MMRRLLAPLSRWLDRRIDARIKASFAEERRQIALVEKVQRELDASRSRTRSA